MKKYILPLILICYITFTLTSCAPAPENAHHAIEGRNYLALGMYHSIISPLAVIGRILGLNIGIYDSGKDVFSYWLGYTISVIFYVRIIRATWLSIMFDKRNS